MCHSYISSSIDSCEHKLFCKMSKTSQAVPDNVVYLQKIGQPLLSFSMVLIYVYLMIYIFYEAYTKIIDDKDEDFVNCTCLGKDKTFYHSLFAIFSIFWFIAVIVWSIVGFIDLYAFR